MAGNEKGLYPAVECGSKEDHDYENARPAAIAILLCKKT